MPIRGLAAHQIWPSELISGNCCPLYTHVDYLVDLLCKYDEHAKDDIYAWPLALRFADCDFRTARFHLAVCDSAALIVRNSHNVPLHCVWYYRPLGHQTTSLVVCFDYPGLQEL